MKLTRPESIIICISAIICAAIAIALVVEEILREHKSKTTHNYLNSTDMTLPRGYRNNNPLNIRNSNEKWAGEIRPSQDPAFKQFKSMGYGFRAALKLLRNYIGKGYNTIEKIINRWAPPTENHTESYIKNVSSRSGIPANVIISRDDREKLIEIAYAMAISENGQAPDRQDIETGWSML